MPNADLHSDPTLQPIRSERVAGLVQSEIRAMTERCVELDGVNHGQGVCDTPAVQHRHPSAERAAAAQLADFGGAHSRLL